MKEKTPPTEQDCLNFLKYLEDGDSLSLSTRKAFFNHDRRDEAVKMFPFLKEVIENKRKKTHEEFKYKCGMGGMR